VDEERQFIMSAVGLHDPWATQREMPLAHSFCPYLVESGEPLIIADAREHPLHHDHLAIAAMGFVAYAGMPLTTPNGQRIGSLCVVDVVPRIWAEAEIALLRDLSALANTEIKLLVDTLERTQAEIALAEREAMLRSIGDNLPNGMIFQVIQAAEDQLQFT
jgi:GAF domain-containing protein